MHWINSDNKLPENMKDVFIKYYYKGKKDTAIGKCNTLYPMKNWSHKNGIPLTFDSLEWLDESAESPSPEQERVKQLEESLRTAYNLMTTSGPLTIIEIFDQIETILQTALK